jgi:hypothetical protein
VGSVRNPVGPLPSSIYWRRRAVVLCLVALLIALITWAVTSASGGKSGNGANGKGGRPPATTITPGPTPSGPFVSGRPGGSDGGGDGTSGGGSGGDDTTAGSAGDGSGTGGTSTGGGADGGGGTGGSGSGGTTAELHAGSSLPDCTPTTVSISLRSVKNSYEPYDKPQFRLVATNGGATACKLNFAPTSAVFTIEDVDDRHVWASDDCPAGRSAHLLQVPANGTTAYTTTWDRKTSSPQCATPKGQPVPNGATYLVEVKLPGFAVRPTSFFLKSA